MVARDKEEEASYPFITKTAEQTEMIDKQQIRALKLIYGFDKSTNQVLEMSGLETMALRRSKAVDRFALKLVASERFGHLFPERPQSQCRSRGSRKYEEQHAKLSLIHI